MLVTIVGALADLLVPKSLVRAGLDGIRWLVELPAGRHAGRAGRDRGGGADAAPACELREVLTWIGVTLLPLGRDPRGRPRVSRARASTRESPSELLGRVAGRRRRAWWSMTGRGAC